MYKHLLILAFSIAVIFACAKKRDRESQEFDANEMAIMLKGQWATKCRKADSTDAETYYYREILSFNDSPEAVGYEIIFSLSSKCEKGIFARYKMEADTKLAESAVNETDEIPTNTRKIEYSRADVPVLAAKNQTGVDILEINETCDIEEWHINRPRMVDDCESILGVRPDQNRFESGLDLIHINLENMTLSLGKGPLSHNVIPKSLSKKEFRRIGPNLVAKVAIVETEEEKEAEGEKAEDTDKEQNPSL